MGVLSAVIPRVARRPWSWWLGVRALEMLFGLRAHGGTRVPNDRPVVFAGNHGSHYDGFFSTAAVLRVQRRLPVPVAWGGMRDYPILREIAKSGLPIVWQENEGPLGGGATVLQEMMGHLMAGRSLVIHCEGRRNDRLGPFQKGAAVVALRCGAPVVPFTLCGVQGLFSSVSGPDRYHGRVSIHFHEPVLPGEFADREPDIGQAAALMTELIRTRVASCLDYPDALSENSKS